MCALALNGCTKSESDGNLSVYHGSEADDIKTLDPANAYDTISLDIVPMIYETLYQYDYVAETYKAAPLLAADMPKYSKDRLTLTIPIKHGVMFQDDPCFKETKGKGRELKAQDFIYAFKRLAHPQLQSQGWWIFDGKVVGINAFHDKIAKISPITAKGEFDKAFAEEIEGLKAVDDYTVQIKLIKPYPQLMYVLIMSFAAAVPHEAVEAYADEKGNLSDHPVGTGPYILKSWVRGNRVVLDRNPTHHPEFYPIGGGSDAGKALPLLDRVSLAIIKEQQPAWLRFLNGELDMASIPKDNFQSAITNQVNLSPDLAKKGIQLKIEHGAGFYYIAINTKDKTLSNKYLRQAIASSVSREKWTELFTNGRGIKATTALPPGIADRPLNTHMKYDYNLPLAKELLKKAGYPEGKGLPVLNFDMRGAASLDRQMGEFFEHQLGEAGIKVNIIYNTFPAYLEKSKQGNLQLSLGGWVMDYPDGENVYQLVYGPNGPPGPNDSSFDNPAMNKMYEEIAVMETGPKRAQIIAKMDDLLQEECPWGLGYYAVEYHMQQSWLKNFRPSDIITNKYKYFNVDKDIKAQFLGKK